MSEKLSVWIDKKYFIEGVVVEPVYPHELKDIIQPKIKALESKLAEAENWIKEEYKCYHPSEVAGTYHQISSKRMDQLKSILISGERRDKK